jgi:hypothetical protein
MTFQHIQKLIGEAPRNPLGCAPVRRASHRKGRCEAAFWQPTSRQDARRILFAARRYEWQERQPGERSGPLGSVAIELLELLVHMVDFRTGRLDPSIETMMRRLKRSKDAIVRAMKNLRRHGFIDWLRRYEPTGNEGRGPQLRQTSNAYRLCLPARAQRILGYLGIASPVPDDHGHARDARAAESEERLASLPLDRWATFIADDDAIGRTLARFGRSIEQRESAGQEESLIHRILGTGQRTSSW